MAQGLYAVNEKKKEQTNHYFCVHSRLIYFNQGYNNSSLAQTNKNNVHLYNLFELVRRARGRKREKLISIANVAKFAYNCSQIAIEQNRMRYIRKILWNPTYLLIVICVMIWLFSRNDNIYWIQFCEWSPFSARIIIRLFREFARK